MWTRTHGWGGHRPQGDTTAIILLNRCNIKAPSKVASLYLLDLIRRISLCSGWQLTQKFGTRAKPKYTSVTNRTSVSICIIPLLYEAQRPLQERGSKDCNGQKSGRKQDESISGTRQDPVLLNSQSCGCLDKIKPANIPVQSRQGAHESPLLTEALLEANGFWR